MVHIGSILGLVVITCVVVDFLIGCFMIDTLIKRKLMESYHNTVFPEDDFQSYGDNCDAPRKMKLDVKNNCFNDFSEKLIKVDTLFRKIHLESITLFGGVTSVKILPYCINAVAYTNDALCFKNTKIYNLENLKLENIEIGRSTIHNKKKNRFLYVTHKFDELVVSGTINFVEAGSIDEYNTTIHSSHLIIYRDYENRGLFSLEFPFPECHSMSDTGHYDEYVSHAVGLHLKRAHDMNFYLPVGGFNGLLNEIENEMNTPSGFFPENIDFSCSDFPERDETKARSMFIRTENMRLNAHNYDVINNVKFIDMGDSYYTRFEITFNELAFNSKLLVTINDRLALSEDVLVELKKLYIEIVYYPLKYQFPNIQVAIKDGLSFIAEKKIDPYFYTPHFKGKLSSCIKATTLYNLQATLRMFKGRQLQQNLKANYTSP